MLALWHAGSTLLHVGPPGGSGSRACTEGLPPLPRPRPCPASWPPRPRLCAHSLTCWNVRAWAQHQWLTPVPRPLFYAQALTPLPPAPAPLYYAHAVPRPLFYADALACPTTVPLGPCSTLMSWRAPHPPCALLAPVPRSCPGMPHTRPLASVLRSCPDMPHTGPLAPIHTPP